MCFVEQKCFPCFLAGPSLLYFWLPARTETMRLRLLYTCIASPSSLGQRRWWGRRTREQGQWLRLVPDKCQTPVDYCSRPPTAARMFKQRVLLLNASRSTWLTLSPEPSASHWTLSSEHLLAAILVIYHLKSDLVLDTFSTLCHLCRWSVSEMPQSLTLQLNKKPNF